MTQWQAYLDANRKRFLDELFEFLRIPSISSLPENQADVVKAAQWVKARLNAAGMENTEILPTGGHPVVYGEWLNAPDKPTVLIYGHFDTQPVDPLDLWETSPFEPTLRDDRIYARGASDDKGNMFLPITACEALLNTSGTLPLNVKFFFEGQEEIGSPQLPEFLAENRERFSCDLVLSADGGQLNEDLPSLAMSTRGLASLFLDVRGPGHDLHSGTYGGTIANPIHALALILASLHDKDGRVAVEGFYEDVRALTDEERAATADVPFDEEEYLSQIGASELFGEPGFSTWERGWSRPTIEVNGIYGGFQGAGVKTVLPSTAHAKLSCRLVANQDPKRITRLVSEHIERTTPPGVTVTVTEGEKGAYPYQLPPDHPGIAVAASVLEDLYGKPPLRVGMGGTIPVNGLFLRELKAGTVIFGFGLPDERQHSPNEFFRLSGFDRGQRAYAMILERLGETKP